MIQTQTATPEPHRAPPRRPVNPIAPYMVRAIHRLETSADPVTTAEFGDQLEMKPGSVSSMISSIRTILDRVGAGLVLEGSDDRRGYRLHVPNRAAFDALVGPRPDSLSREHAPFRGFQMIKATVLRTVVEAAGKEVPAGTMAQAIYGSRGAETQHRIYAAVHRIRDTLRLRGESYTIACRGLPADRAYALEKVEPMAPAAAPDPRLDRAGRIKGITLPPCGYAAWNFMPASTVRGGVHVVRVAGEDQDRVLTELARSQGVTTDKAPQSVTLGDEGGDEAGEA